jgi:response regulator RpfG family c-di-GMP phosphodiesterase
MLAIEVAHLHTSPVIRPCFLVIDHEFPDSISTRKLVLETAKYNVITAYSAKEAVETFRLFPSVSGIVMNEAVTGTDCTSLVNELRAIRSDILLIVTSSRGPTDCVVADHQLNNFDPAALLNLLRKLVPNPLEHYLSE